jgi:serine/threonine-protein kinase
MTSSGNRRPRSTDKLQALMTSAASAPAVAGYRIDRMLGEGGFGQVWRATRDRDGGLVAIKILHLELVRSNDALTRFARELSAIDRLNHRSVVRALDSGTLDDTRPYLVLEYIDGPSLRDVIHERRALPPAEVLAILEPLCDALATAHDLELVHRDVKASNVILGHDALGLRPVLLDFGLVKLLDHAGPSLTSSRSMLGTPAAMAPEQMRGQPVDARTDVYALGLLAFHMMTGAPAFTGAPGVVQSYLQVHGPRPRPSAHVDVDPAIDAPILRALQAEPAGRFPGAREFVEALRAVIAPVSASVEQDVVALYVEGGPADLALAASVATGQRMTIAMTAPDSVIAIAPRGTVDLAVLEPRLRELVSHGARIALGPSRATFVGSVVDGEALDVESWAPYPIPAGMWVSDAL